MASSSSASSPGSEQLCQSCRTRPADHHLCQIIDEQETSLDLCEACFRSHVAQTGLEFPSLDGAQCFYCGGVANAASLNDSWERASRQQRFHYTCRRCAEISEQFLKEALANSPKDLPAEEQSRRIEQMFREADARVRAFIRDAT